MKKYLIRLDDACPQMDSSKWGRMEALMDKYGVKPLVGIIPNNEDPQTIIDEYNDNFANLALTWQKKGWKIALHGYNHVCVTECGGINPVHNRSEFAGLPLEQQVEKVAKGYMNLNEMGLTVDYFFAPSHTYDVNTIKALVEATPIRIISDTMVRFPYMYNDEFTIVPCQMGKCRNIPISGYWTFCYHPNIMSDQAFDEFESFLKANQQKFISFDELPIDKAGKKSLLDKLMSWAYLTLRKVRG